MSVCFLHFHQPALPSRFRIFRRIFHRIFHRFDRDELEGKTKEEWKDIYREQLYISDKEQTKNPEWLDTMVAEAEAKIQDRKQTKEMQLQTIKRIREEQQAKLANQAGPENQAGQAKQSGQGTQAGQAKQSGQGTQAGQKNP